MCVAEQAWLWDFPKARNRKGTRVVQIVWRQSLFDFKYINFKTLVLLAMQYWLRYQLTFIKLICYYVYFFYKLACFYVYFLFKLVCYYVYFLFIEWRIRSQLLEVREIWEPVFCQNIAFDTVNLFLCHLTHLSEMSQMLIFFKFWNGMKKLIQMFHYMDNVLFIWWRRKRYKPIDFQFKISDSSNCTVLPSRQISMPSSTIQIGLY